MKTGKRNKMVGLLVLAILLTMVTTPVVAQAAEPEAGQVIDGSLLLSKTETEAESSNQLLTRGNFLSNGNTKIANPKDGTAIVGGATIGHVICDLLILGINMERLEGSSWNSYDMWDVEKANTSLFTKSKTLTVEPGYYYRVRGAHVAHLGTDMESLGTATSGVWFGQY